jgi:arylformamidase
MRYYDVTQPLYEGMPVYPGDPAVTVRPHCRIDRGDPVNLCAVAFGSHTGTHIDAPRHFLEGAGGVDRIPIETLVGPASVVEVSGAGAVDAAALRGIVPVACRRLLLKTRNSARPPGDRLAPGFAALTGEAARQLVEAGLLLVGLDGPSVDPAEAADAPAHRRLLQAGVVILEGLELSAVPPGEYELLCLPLPLRDGDGAPARVVLRQPAGH